MFNNEQNTYSRQVYDWLCEKWYVVTIVSTLPGVLLSILGISKDIEWCSFLYKDSGFMKIGYIIFFSFVMLICVSVSLLWHWVKHKEDKANDKLMYVYKETKNMAKKYHLKCHKDFKDIFEAEKYKNSVEEALGAINNDSSRLNPIKKVNHILEYANDLLAFVFGLESEDISILLAYNEGDGSDWLSLISRNIDYEEEDVGLLFKNPHSTFANSLHQKWPVFYMKKEDAVKKNQYVPSNYEMANGIKGSIYCKDLSIYDKKKNMKKGFVLAISTRTKQFGKNNSYSKNLCIEILELIEGILKPELDHIYMNYYFNLGGYLNEHKKTMGFTDIIKEKTNRRNFRK